jgi:rod shape-determining protein MreD
MLRIVVLSIIIILNIVLQGTFFQTISISNIAPNLLIITTVSFALIRGKKSGMMMGFILGFLQDMFFGSVLGFYALIYMYCGFICGHFTKSFYRDSLVIPIFIIGIMNVLSNIVIYIFTYLFRGKTDINFYLKTIMLPEFTYTVIIAIFVYKLYFFINNKLDHNES